MLHQVQVAEIDGFESWVSYSKKTQLSAGFLVLSDQMLQNHKLAKVEYV